MKKGKIVKFSAATMVALSAITPVAAFASEAGTQDGFYTGNKFVPAAEFQKMSKSEKKALILENIKANALVLVQNGKVFDLTDEKIANAPANEVEGITVEQYTAETGKTLTQNGIVDGSTELTVKSVSAINSTQAEVTFNKEVKDVKPANFKVTDKDGNLRFVSKVELSEDKKVATLSFFDKFADKGVYTVETTNVVDADGNTIAKATNSFGYEAADVAKVVFTATTVKPGAELKDYVKVTDKLGRDVTAEHTVEFASADTNVINSSGVAQNADGQEALVTATVKDTDVTAKAVIKVSTEAAKTFVGYTTDSTTTNAVDTDAFKKLDADKVFDYVSVTDTSASAKTLAVYTLDQYGKSMTKISAFDSVENLTPNVVIVDGSNGKITPISEGTGYVKVKIGDVEQTVKIDVRAAAVVKDIDVDPTEVNVVEKGLDGEIKLSYKNQYGGKTSGDAAKLSVKSSNTAVATVTKTDANTVTVKGLKTGTATVTMTYKYTVDDKETVIEKVVPVTVSEKGEFADYTVEVPRTTLYSEEDSKTTFDDTKVDVKAYQVDDKGQKIANAGITLVALDKNEAGKEVAVADDAVNNRVKVSGTTVSFKKAGTQKVQVKVGDVVIDTLEFTTVNNTPDVAETVIFDNTAIVVGEFEAADSNAKNINKQLAKIVTLKDKFGDDVTVEAGDAVNFEYTITNENGVTFTGSANAKTIDSVVKQNATADIVVTKVTFTPSGGSASENLLAAPQVVKLSVKDTTAPELTVTSSSGVTNLVLTASEALGYADEADLKDHFTLNVAAADSTATIASAKYDEDAKTITFTITDDSGDAKIAAGDTISVEATLIDAAGNKITASEISEVVDSSGLKWATITPAS